MRVAAGDREANTVGGSPRSVSNLMNRSSVKTRLIVPAIWCSEDWNEPACRTRELSGEVYDGTQLLSNSRTELRMFSFGPAAAASTSSRIEFCRAVAAATASSTPLDHTGGPVIAEICAGLKMLSCGGFTAAATDAAIAALFRVIASSTGFRSMRLMSAICARWGPSGSQFRRSG